MKQEKKTDGPDKDEWRTPPAIFRFLADHLRAELGREISLDAAAGAGNALAALYFTKESNALDRNWLEQSRGGGVFLNPPFSRIREFMAKAAFEAARGCPVVAVAPGTWATQWMHRSVMPTATTLFAPDRRLRYHRPDGGLGDSPNFESVLISWVGPRVLRAQVIPITFDGGGWRVTPEQP